MRPLVPLLLLLLVGCPSISDVDDGADTDTDTDADTVVDTEVDTVVDTQPTCDGCTIDGDCVEPGLSNPDNGCELCDPRQSTAGWSPDLFGTCDDGLDCTRDTCSEGRCTFTYAFTCPWPAESTGQCDNLTELEGPLVNDFHTNLSAATWDPGHRRLWVASNAGPSRVWAIVEDTNGGFLIGERGGLRGEWQAGFGDIEGITLADPSEPDLVYLLTASDASVTAWDLSTYSTAALVQTWDLSTWLAADPARALSFAPDAVLQAAGFVDGDGLPSGSAHGLGGLFLVGQRSGTIQAFDLDRTTGAVVHIGRYASGRTDVTGLEVDGSTGLLFAWHGGNVDMLSVLRLTSSPAGDGRTLDADRGFDAPSTPVLVASNYEGVAIVSNDDCAIGTRSLFLTNNGGGFFSLLRYATFPCEVSP